MLLVLAALAPVPSVVPASTPAGAATPTAGGDPVPRPLRRYVLAILRSGHAPVEIPATRLDTLRAGHMANIRRMFADHRLVCAGPFLDEGELQGIYIFDADSVGQVTPWLDGDPFLATGHMVCDLHPWYGPAGISEVYRRGTAADPTRVDSLLHYTFALLRPGPAAAGGNPGWARSKSQRHLADLEHSEHAGRIAVAGPFETADPLVGLCIYDTADSSEARRWSESDPEIAAGRMRPEFHPWMTARGILAH